MAASKRTAQTTAGKTRRSIADREDLYIAAYMGNGFNRTAAARAAGFSARTAAAKGSEMFARCDERISALVKEKVRTLHLQGDEVLRDLAASFRVDRRQFFNDDGSLKSPTELTEEQARLLDGFDVSVTTYGKGEDAREVTTSKLRLEKHGATRDQAMRHLGLFPRDQGPADPDEQARLVRERLGDIRKLGQKQAAAKGEG